MQDLINSNKLNKTQSRKRLGSEAPLNSLEIKTSC